MLKIRTSLSAALLLAVPATGFAADLYEPPVVELPPPPVIEPAPQPSFGGWYIRGDVDYHWSKLRGTEYITYGPPAGTSSFATSSLKGALSLGAGVGYQINKYLRTDFTADYWFKSDFTGSTVGFCGGAPCASTDSTSYSALLLLANAYVDLGTYHGITPYVGAGIGGAYVMWDDLENTIGSTTTVHRGKKEMRFAYALMAGASYCLTDSLNLDVGYRYSRISGGRMFEYAPIAGPGFDKGFNVHEARAGLRYNFGGNANCRKTEVIAYDPPPYEPPVFK